MGKASRDKGLRCERAIVDVHRKSGIHAERVPLSGALGYRGNDADVDLYVRGAEPVKVEVKARGDGAGFKTLLRWIGNKDALVLIQDRTMPLVVVRFDVWLEVARRSALLREPDGDRDRDQRRRSAEQGPLPPTDAIAREAA
jgi:hypothetical protein